MEIRVSRRVRELSGYAFAEVDQQVEKLRQAGIDPIDFGVGDPTQPTPEFVRKACSEALDTRASYGYPSYVGDPGFRDAAAEWISRRFGVELDPQTEITSTVGSK